MSHAGSDAALTLEDYARLARTRLPREIWDFIEGGAGDERVSAANREAFDRIRLCPRVLTGSGIADTGTGLFGRAWSAPIGVSPLAYHTLVHPEGELATVAAAGAAGLPVVLSMFAGRAFKELRPATDAPLWLQIYCLRDRDLVRGLIETAQDSGIEALVLTVDAPHLGRRLRDLRNDFRLPPGVHPANLPQVRMTSPGEHARAQMDPALDWSVIDWLRSVSPLPLLLKGILGPRAARRAIDAGADGIVVSNHGGRQLDAAAATAQVLPAVAAAVAKRVPVLVDGAVRRGTDVLAALACGADAVLIGRPVLHGLAADGREGVARVLDIIREELRDAMTLAGVGRIGDIASDLVYGSTEPGSALPAVEPYRGAAALRRSPAGSASMLARELLHPSLSDPDMDTMGFLNEIADRFPDAVSFAPGRPYEGFFEIESVFDAVRGFLDHLTAGGLSPGAARSALYQYGPSAGIINALISDSLREDEGIDAAPDSIVVTVGAQEAMVLVLRALFADRDDVLLVSTPCYVGITGAAKLLDISTLSVPERDEGLRPRDVADAVRGARAAGRRPKALYLVPDHSNPSGNTLGLAARRELLELAARHDLLLIEDSPYRLVSDGEQLPTLKALDRDRRVVHIGSFAKSAFPGARVGYVVADQPVAARAGQGGGPGKAGLLADELAKIKSMVTVNTSPLSQAAVAGLMLACGGRLSRFNQRQAAHYRDNLGVLLGELDACFPAARRDRLGLRWNRPAGGFFLGMHVPFRADDEALERSAREFGVLWTPMSYFYPDGRGGRRQLRLSFSALTPDLIREGTRRLAEFIQAQASC